MASPPPLTALLLLVLLIATIAPKAAPAAAPCNGTRIADCYDDGDEFSMESEASRRILLVGNGRQTKYTSFKTKPYCDRNKYWSCIGPKNKVYANRKCNYNTCRRVG